MKDVCKIPELGIGKNNVIKRQDVQLIRTQFDKCYIVFWIAEKGSKKEGISQIFCVKWWYAKNGKAMWSKVSKHKKI